jgi:hypothetical protein
MLANLDALKRERAASALELTHTCRMRFPQSAKPAEWANPGARARLCSIRVNFCSHCLFYWNLPHRAQRLAVVASSCLHGR